MNSILVIYDIVGPVVFLCILIYLICLLLLLSGAIFYKDIRPLSIFNKTKNKIWKKHEKNN